MGHDIHGAVYESDEVLLDANLYNPEAYRPSTACTLEHSRADIVLDQGIRLEEGERVEASYVSDHSNMVFLVISNDDYSEEQTNRTKKLAMYSINGTSLENKGESDISDMGLTDEESVEIRMVEVNGVLLMTDGLVVKAINSTSSWDVPVEVKIKDSTNNNADWMATDY